MQSEVARTVWASAPGIHGEQQSACFSLSLEALQWLEEHVERTMRTLETGSGASTVVFASRGSRHTAISPSATEHEAICAYCDAQGIDVGGLTFVAESSHTALARESEPIDIALIDGAHEFPYPVLDWFEIQSRLREGGMLLVDDSYMPAVNTLVNYLRQSPDWEYIGAPGGRTTVFRKLRDGLPAFFQQPPVKPSRVTFNYLPLSQRIPATAQFVIINRAPSLARRLSAARRARAR
ncbi:MAG TPA: class I SAM-dependent methyltransferase [Solirubrobacteraceae bacterium]|jgi:predicted O-methyltransferase YrrM|nr:class I SAM-dependent methyltransferase [Solirubrobacteraceae bacterium]